MNNDKEERAQQPSHREDEREESLRSASHDEATEQRRVEPQPEYDSFMRIIRR